MTTRCLKWSSGPSLLPWAEVAGTENESARMPAEASNGVQRIRRTDMCPPPVEFAATALSPGGARRARVDERVSTTGPAYTARQGRPEPRDRASVRGRLVVD